MADATWGAKGTSLRVITLARSSAQFLPFCYANLKQLVGLLYYRRE